MEPFIIWATLWVLGWSGLSTNFIMMSLGLIGLAGLQFQPFLETIKPEHQKARWFFWNQIYDMASLLMMLVWMVFFGTMPPYGWVVGFSIAIRAAFYMHVIPTTDIPTFLEDKAGLFLLWSWMAGDGGEAHYFWLLLVAILAGIRFVPSHQKPAVWIGLLVVNGLADLWFVITRAPPFYMTGLLLNLATALVVVMNRWYFFV